MIAIFFMIMPHCSKQLNKSYLKENTVNQLFYATIDFRDFSNRDILAVIYFCGFKKLKNIYIFFFAVCHVYVILECAVSIIDKFCPPNARLDHYSM